MKPKLILGLALVVVGSWWIVFFASGKLTNWLYDRQQRQNEPTVTRIRPEGLWAKKLKTPWTDTKIVLYRATGEVIQLNAKQAVYTVWSIKNPAKKGKEFDCPVTTFIDPETRNVWIGGVDTGQVETNEYENAHHIVSTNYLVYTNFFIENDSEILRGDSTLVDGTFACDESVIQKAQPNEGLDSVIERFDKSTNTAWPFSSADWTTGFFHDFRDGFFDSGEYLGNQVTQIQHIEVANGKLRLDFNSHKFGTVGSVWLNLKTLKVIKATEHK
jgi:hypothetical protein